MLRHKPERWIALSVIACSLLLVGILVLIVGKGQFSPHRRTVDVYFQSCIGIEGNSPIKYAGAPVGRVVSVSVVPRAEQLRGDGKAYFVKARLSIDDRIEIGSDARFEIKADGVLGSKFIGIVPGRPDAPLLADDAEILGASPVDLVDLASPVKDILESMKPVAESLNENVPVLMTRLDSVLASGDDLLKDVATEENRQRINDLLANLRVVSANLKVVSTNAKAFTSTIGQRPWRLFFGGTPNSLPSEKDILSSPKPLPAPGTQ